LELIAFKEMMEKMEHLSHEICEWNILYTKAKMRPLTNTENKKILNSTKCYLCGKCSNVNVRDHDHFSGNSRINNRMLITIYFRDLS